MDNSRKFVYNTGGSSKRPITSSDPSFLYNLNSASAHTDGQSEGTMSLYVDDFNLDDDDDIISQADFDRIEHEAKITLQTKNQEKERGLSKFDKNVSKIESNRPKDVVVINDNTYVPGSGAQLQHFSAQLEEYKSKIKNLENSLYAKDGELKILRSSLEKHRQDNAEKSEKIIQLRNKQIMEKNQRESDLIKEVSSLKTRLSFQEQELRGQSKKIESHKVFNTTSGVKRKAELGEPNGYFRLDNSFLSSQHSSGKKMARISEKNLKMNENCEVTSKNTSTRKENVAKPADSSGAQTTYFPNRECRGTQLVKNLLHTNNVNIADYSDQDMEPISLLNLLKYPLKRLPDVLEAHSVNTTADGPSQFPHWQSQRTHVSPIAEKSMDPEALDMDSGKYNLVNQGLFLLLGFPNKMLDTGVLDKGVEPVLGGTHILVLLELYISCYLFQRNEIEGCYNDGQEGVLNKANDNDKQTFEDEEIVLQSLQLLKVLLHAAPKLVGCILGRTSSSIFLLNDDVIIIETDASEIKNTAGLSNSTGHIPGGSDHCTLEESFPPNWSSDVLESEHDTTMGSFRSLLLSNLEKLLDPRAEESLTICHAALDVLIAMTTVCERTELERIFLFIKRGCVATLLSKDTGSSTLVFIMSLLKNLLPCKGMQKILCSQTDSCILLKIYQCICDEEDKDINDLSWNNFLLQVVEFVESIAFSHSDNILFLLETDCQCSLEIVRCLVLVLHDKVNYLLSLDSDIVTSDVSLTILRTGMIVLVILCTHTSYSPDHKLDVEHHYIELICKVMILYKNIKDFIPEVEALGVQDLLDLEQIDEIEWSLGSDDEDEECMEIDG